MNVDFFSCYLHLSEWDVYLSLFPTNEA